MKDFQFDFTICNTEESQKEFISKKYEPVWKISKMISFESFINVIKRYPQFEPWYLDSDFIYKRENFEDKSHFSWRNFSFYILDNGKSEPDLYCPTIYFGLKAHTNKVTAVSYGRINIELVKLFYEIASHLDSTLYLDNGNFVTPKYIAKLELRSNNDRPKLTQKQEEVLFEVENDAAWIYLPTDKTQEVIFYIGASSKESEIVSGLYKAFEKDFTGLATYQSHSILFGKNLMTLPVPNLKNSSKPINDDDLQKIIWNLSIRFGEAQFYSYNEYEVWYIHYKNGELVYYGTNGDDGPSHIIGSITEEIELSESKVKELAEANGIGLEDFLMGCMKEKIKCHLIAAKNGAQVWWDGIMNDVNKAMKEDKKK